MEIVAPRIVVLTGAGVSAESGLGTFRDVGGLWIWSRVRLEDVATPEAFARNPEAVLAFYDARRAACASATPNAAHAALARLTTALPGEALIVTQNTILMLDFVGFTEMAVTQDPPELIRELNDIFSGFDRIVEEFGCERLKTIGDAYMAVSGLPVETPDHAANVAAVALRMRRFLERRNATNANKWLCRIGVHSGRVVGSIVGVRKYVYDVFGPGVNTAARLEAMAAPMDILVSNATRKRLGRDVALKEVGLRQIRGEGPVRVFRLLGDDALGD